MVQSLAVPKPDSSLSAIVVSGGKQYRVAPGDRILVDRLSAEPGSSLKLDRVLLFRNGNDIAVGGLKGETKETKAQTKTEVKSKAKAKTAGKTAGKPRATATTAAKAEADTGAEAKPAKRAPRKKESTK